MKELQDLRAALDETDRTIVAAFEKRMEISLDVARAKIAAGLPVLDASRERQVLDSRAACLKDPALDADVRALFETIMARSRLAQERLMKEAEQK